MENTFNYLQMICYRCKGLTFTCPQEINARDEHNQLEFSQEILQGCLNSDLTTFLIAFVFDFMLCSMLKWLADLCILPCIQELKVFK